MFFEKSRGGISELVLNNFIFHFILNLSSNMVGYSNDETSFPHKYLLTITQVSGIPKAFTNSSLANKKSSKPPKTVQS